MFVLHLLLTQIKEICLVPEEYSEDVTYRFSASKARCIYEKTDETINFVSSYCSCFWAF